MLCPQCGHHNVIYNTKCASCHVVNIVQPTTQKGIGLKALMAKWGAYTCTVLAFVRKEEDIPKHLPYQVFTRPAPATPKHGYIDSRVTSTREEIAALLKEVLADDPNGELILCGYIDSAFNAIITPGSISVGKGNDGATAGKNTVMVPLTLPADVTKVHLPSAGIHSDQWPYVEVVYSKGNIDNPIFTQIRGGPKTPSLSGDYIPFPTEVTKVLVADVKRYKDRGWEKEIEAHTWHPGVVVWHPGGTMTSHFSIHAFAAKIPIIFGDNPPSVGSLLEPTQEVDDFDPQAMLQGFVVGSKVRLSTSNDSDHITAALIALHSSTAMTGPHSRWVGYSAAIMLRAGVAALNGEARHFGVPDGKPGRETVYNQAFKRTTSYHRARILRLINIFRYGQWPSSGFGGIKWACCGAGTVDLFNAVYNLAKSPTPGAAAKVVQALNIMVNQAHNGGWWFNKFVNASLFTTIAKGSLVDVAKSGPLFYKVNAVMEKVPQALLDKEIDRIKTWGLAMLNPPRTTSAKVIVHPGIGAIEIKIFSRLLKTKVRSIKAKLPKLETGNLKDLRQHLYLVEGEDGYQLELRKNNPVIIWRDESLRGMSIEASKKVAKGGE